MTCDTAHARRSFLRLTLRTEIKVGQAGTADELRGRSGEAWRAFSGLQFVRQMRPWEPFEPKQSFATEATG